MKRYKILERSFLIVVLITTSVVLSNEVFASSKPEKFIQQNNFTLTEVKEGLMEISGWSSSGLVVNGTMLVNLEFENGSKTSYNDVKTLGTEFGNGFVQDNDSIGPSTSGVGGGNHFVQNNNITLSDRFGSGGIVDSGFVQNNNITLSGGNQTGNGFVQNNSVRGGWISNG
jgi:hypothetical protein